VTRNPDHFERLGLPRRFALDGRELERAWLERSRAVHPDYHQLGASAEQQASLELSAALNDAHATLRDPFRRAEYLLSLAGGPSASEYRGMSSAFLAETLEFRERIEQMRAAGPDAVAGQAEMEAELAGRQQALFDEVAARFAEWEALPAADERRAGLLVRLRESLNALKFVRGLLRDLRAE
jgi:molecular chaperone HscB